MGMFVTTSLCHMFYQWRCGQLVVLFDGHVCHYISVSHVLSISMWTTFGAVWWACLSLHLCVTCFINGDVDNLWCCLMGMFVTTSLCYMFYQWRCGPLVVWLDGPVFHYISVSHVLSIAMWTTCGAVWWACLSLHLCVTCFINGDVDNLWCCLMGMFFTTSLCHMFYQWRCGQLVVLFDGHVCHYISMSHVLSMAMWTTCGAVWWACLSLHLCVTCFINGDVDHLWCGLMGLFFTTSLCHMFYQWRCGQLVVLFDGHVCHYISMSHVLSMAMWTTCGAVWWACLSLHLCVTCFINCDVDNLWCCLMGMFVTTSLCHMFYQWRCGLLVVWLDGPVFHYISVSHVLSMAMWTTCGAVWWACLSLHLCVTCFINGDVDNLWCCFMGMFVTTSLCHMFYQWRCGQLVVLFDGHVCHYISVSHVLSMAMWTTCGVDWWACFSLHLCVTCFINGDVDNLWCGLMGLFFTTYLCHMFYQWRCGQLVVLFDGHVCHYISVSHVLSMAMWTTCGVAWWACFSLHLCVTCFINGDVDNLWCGLMGLFFTTSLCHMFYQWRCGQLVVLFDGHVCHYISVSHVLSMAMWTTCGVAWWACLSLHICVTCFINGDVDNL